MLAEFAFFFQELYHSPQVNPYISGFLTALLVPCIFLLVWRLWAFTVHPMLRPREPRELPYWIPGQC